MFSRRDDLAQSHKVTKGDSFVNYRALSVVIQEVLIGQCIIASKLRMCLLAKFIMELEECFTELSSPE